MKQARIAELKAHLSEYLRAARGGQTITVLDRETPIAQIVPISKTTALRVRKPLPGAPPIQRIPRPKPLELDSDIVDLLMEERQSYR